MSEHNPVVIASASDDRYCMGLAVALVSALGNCRGWVSEPVLIVVLDGGIQPRNWRRLEKSLDSVGVPHRISRFKPDLSLFEGFPMDYGASYLTYARLLLPKLLPKVRRILYIDSDLLVADSLEAIWKIELGATPLAACVCAHVKRIDNESLPVEELDLNPAAPYLQAGFLLIDLDAWREMNLSELCLNYLHRFPDRAPHWDQSALNAVIDQKWTPLEERWNVPAAYFESKDEKWKDINPAVLHYSGPDKPWRYGNHTWGVARTFFSLLDQTAWRGWRPSRLRAVLKIWKCKLHECLKPKSRKFKTEIVKEMPKGTRDPFVIATSANSGYAIGLTATIVSALEHAPLIEGETATVVVLDGGVRDSDWRRFEGSLVRTGVPHKIVRIRPDLTVFRDFPTDYGVSHMSYARLLLPDLLPEVGRLLYLDSDLILVQSVAPVWEMNLKGNLVAATTCPVVRTLEQGKIPVGELGLLSESPYLQSGFMLMDLDAWRACGFSEQCRNYLTRFPDNAPHWDQSAINAMVGSRWTYIDSKWNVSAMDLENGNGGNVEDVCVIHYSGPFKPWNYGVHRWECSKYFYELLPRTEWSGWRPSRARHLVKTIKWRVGHWLGKW